MQVGDKVRINPSSQYVNESRGIIGTVSRISGSTIFVRWGSPRSSEYQYIATDLIKVSENEKSISRFYKERNLSEEDQKLIHVGIKDEDLRLTEAGKDIVFDLMARTPSVKKTLLGLADSFVEKEDKKE